MKKVFMVGINGSGMSKLAYILSDLGYAVYGTDVLENEATSNLRKKGITFFPNAKFLPQEDFEVVIFSSAVQQSNEILLEAARRGLKVKRRAEVLAEIASEYKSIVVAGTHGKTTTTSLIYHILNHFSMANGYVGGVLSKEEKFSPEREYFVIESDESDRSFLLFNPEILVVTSVDRDHLNTYEGSFEKLKEAFSSLMEKSRSLVISFDDINAREIGFRFGSKSFYSLENREVEMFAGNIRYDKNGVTCDIYESGNFVGEFRLPVFGEKNVLNSIAALLVAKKVGIGISEAVESLESFSLPKRRFEIKFEFGGIVVIDDHADHPTEIEATLKAVREHFPGRRVVAVFEPHRYTRVASLGSLIAKPFKYADLVICTEIYPAFEEPIPGVNGESVFSLLKSENSDKPVYFANDYNIIVKTALQILRSGDVLVVLGPGEIHKVIEPLIRSLKNEKH